MDDDEIARLDRSSRRGPEPRPSVRNPMFLGRVTTAAPAVGKFMKVLPVALSGAESEGSAGVRADLGTTPTLVYLAGPGVPATGDEVACVFEDYRWVAWRRGTAVSPPPCPGGYTLSGHVATGCYGGAPGETVQVYDASMVLRATTTTDASGNFSVSMTYNGVLTIVITDNIYTPALVTATYTRTAASCSAVNLGTLNTGGPPSGYWQPGFSNCTLLFPTTLHLTNSATGTTTALVANFPGTASPCSAAGVLTCNGAEYGGQETAPAAQGFGPNLTGGRTSCSTLHAGSGNICYVLTLRTDLMQFFLTVGFDSCVDTGFGTGSGWNCPGYGLTGTPGTLACSAVSLSFTSTFTAPCTFPPPLGTLTVTP